MDNQKTKMPTPFQVPEGYFDDFENNLSARLDAAQAEKPLKVVHRNRNIGIWVAAAAVGALLMVNGWVFWDKLAQKPQQSVIAAVNKPNVEMAKPAELNTEPKAVSIDAVVEDLLDVSYNSTVEAQSPTKSEKAIALELEDAGLLVAELEVDIFDEFDIMP